MLPWDREPVKINTTLYEDILSVVLFPGLLKNKEDKKHVFFHQFFTEWPPLHLFAFAHITNINWIFICIREMPQAPCCFNKFDYAYYNFNHRRDPVREFAMLWYSLCALSATPPPSPAPAPPKCTPCFPCASEWTTCWIFTSPSQTYTETKIPQ